MSMAKIAKMTGISMKKVMSVLGNSIHGNLKLVSPDEIAKIRDAATEIDYEYKKAPSQKGNEVRKVTMRMVAAEAGVKMSTVSATFSPGIRQVSKKTREHVLRFAAQMGYKLPESSNIKNFYKRKSEDL